jgi:spore coat polysaccharide biosynthesis protein SpsF (cytidylyltransferase family)
MDFKDMNLAIVIQARMNSKRLPGKSLMKIGTKPLVSHVIERAIPTKLPVFLSIPTSSSNDVLERFVLDCYPIQVHRGSEDDVRERYLEIINKFSFDHVVRITADDPFKDPIQISLAIKDYLESETDYYCNFYEPTLPVGLDIEIFRSRALFDDSKRDSSSYTREHVTPGLRENPIYTKFYINQKPIRPDLRLTVDYAEDLEYCSEIAKNIAIRNPDSYSLEATLASVDEVDKLRNIND